MGNTTNRAKDNAKKTVSMEAVLDNREQAIKAKVETLRKVAKDAKAKVNTDFWAKDVTYCMGFGDIETKSSRCTIWVTSRKVYCDYGNTNKVLFEACEAFGKSHEDKVQYTNSGIVSKVERRFTTDMDTATELIQALVKATATPKPKAKPKAKAKDNTTGEAVKGA